MTPPLPPVPEAVQEAIKDYSIARGRIVRMPYPPSNDPKYERRDADLLAAEAALDLRIREALATEGQCSTCGGTPHASGVVCVCGGTNKAYREAQGLREALYDMTQIAEKAEAALAWLVNSTDVPPEALLKAIDDARTTLEPEARQAERRET